MYQTIDRQPVKSYIINSDLMRLKCCMMQSKIFQPLLDSMPTHSKILINCLISFNFNSCAMHYDDITFFREQRHFGMKHCIFTWKVVSVTSVLCLTTTNLPQLDKCMNW